TLGDASGPRLVSFTVAPGTARLRAALNGIDAGVNDIDLYLKQGAPPTTLAFDAKSDNAGVYESIDIATPAAGTWYALVQPVGERLPSLPILTAQGRLRHPPFHRW